MKICTNCRYNNNCKYKEVVYGLENSINEGTNNTPLICILNCKNYSSIYNNIPNISNIKDVGFFKQRILKKAIQKYLPKNELTGYAIDIRKYNDIYVLLTYNYPIFNNTDNLLDQLYFNFYIIDLQPVIDYILYYDAYKHYDYTIKWHGFLRGYNADCVRIYVNRPDYYGEKNLGRYYKVFIYLINEHKCKNWKKICNLIDDQYKIKISGMPDYRLLNKNTE